MKRLAVTLLVLLGLLLAADRGGAALAAQAVAQQAQAEARLAAPPEVSLGGFPFLTQALAGRYDEVTVRATDVPAGEVRLSAFEAVLSGVELPLRDALSRAVTAVPVEGLLAEAVVGYDELTRQSGEAQLVVAPAGDGRVRVTGEVEVLGRTVSATAVSRVELTGQELLVTAESYEVGDQTADALLTRALGGRLDLRLPIEGLPYGLEVRGLEVRRDGVAVLAGAGRTVLGRP